MNGWTSGQRCSIIGMPESEDRDLLKGGGVSGNCLPLVARDDIRLKTQRLIAALDGQAQPLDGAMNRGDEPMMR